MFSKLFGKKPPEAPPRVVESPESLKIGDMVEMVDSFGLPAELRGQTLQVIKVNTYEFEHQSYPEFQLQGGSNTPIHMTVENEDGEQLTIFSMKVSRQTVESILDMDTFSLVFEEDICREPIRATNPDAFPRWMAPVYRQSNTWSKGYFHEKDYRHSPIPSYEHKGAAPFETVTLTSDDEKHSLCIEVWEDGETDVSLAIEIPATEIKSYYAKS